MTCSLRLMRWTDALLAIHRSKEPQCYCERLCRVIGCSRTHIRVIVKLLVENELVEIIPVKNVEKLCLTKKGRRVTMSLLALRSELNGIRAAECSINYNDVTQTNTQTFQEIQDHCC